MGSKLKISELCFDKPTTTTGSIAGQAQELKDILILNEPRLTLAEGNTCQRMPIVPLRPLSTVAKSVVKTTTLLQ
jgi:hypothetical protein